ncbi:MAG: response regulator [Candidatus Cloacimonetes bacterium]|nr:response regulator [Candidatus Cloacimonadota bacterium]
MKKHILIVDDEQTIRELCKELLQDEGYKVTLAVDGQDALDKMDYEIFDLFLLDMAMPRLGGLELMRMVKIKQPLAVIVILTGFSSIDGAVQAVHAGAFQYLSKPINSEKLFEVVKAGCKHSEDLYGPLQKAFEPETDAIQKDEPIMLHGFSPEDKTEFINLGRIKNYEIGDAIPFGNDDSNSIIIIDSGEVSVWLSNTIIDYLQKLDSIGEESIILSGSTDISLRAETAVKLRHFSRKKILDFFAYKGDKLLKRFMINLLNSTFFKWRKAAQRIIMLKLVS